MHKNKKYNGQLERIAANMTLEGGYSYLIKDMGKGARVKALDDDHLIGQKLLYISRSAPEKESVQAEPKSKSYIWLTYNKGPNCIEPTNITRLSIKIHEFINKNKNATIFFDGIEYLTTQNDFSTVLRFIQLLNDKIMISDSKLFLSINPKAFKENELALIEREMEPFE